MTSMTIRIHSRFCAATIAGSAAALLLVGCDNGDAIARAGVIAVDSDGKLRVPEGYRTSFQLLGSWASAKDDGPGSAELHVVYADPSVIGAYRESGHFPDGAVLVKEVFAAATGQMTTGVISRADKLLGWFVMVRDRKGAHSPSETWGDGWGWAWFDASDPTKASRNLPTKDGIPKATSDYRDNCLPCHAPAKSTEWVYVDGYPPLRR